MDQKFLLFQFERDLYKYTCLPNGLSSAPKKFTKILEPVFSALGKESHQIMGYLDDNVLMGDTFNEWKNTVLASMKLITNLGVFYIQKNQNFSLPRRLNF